MCILVGPVALACKRRGITGTPGHCESLIVNLFLFMTPTPLAACRDDELDRLQADELERRREALERRIQKRRQRAHNSRGSRPASASPRARMDIAEEVARWLGRQRRSSI